MPALNVKLGMWRIGWLFVLFIGALAAICTFRWSATRAKSKCSSITYKQCRCWCQHSTWTLHSICSTFELHVNLFVCFLFLFIYLLLFFCFFCMFVLLTNFFISFDFVCLFNGCDCFIIFTVNTQQHLIFGEVFALLLFMVLQFLAFVLLDLSSCLVVWL